MTKANVLVALCCGALCALPAFSQAKAPMSDQEFVNMAAETDMTEAHLGQMAADQASSQAVKDYAQMLVTDHTNNYNELTAAATKAGLSVPKGIDASHDRMIAGFKRLKGAAFDRAYVHDMVAGHTKATAAFQEYANSGQNADIKAYATATLPTLQKHLDGAHDLVKSKGAAPRP